MSCSPARLAANRLNARKSTGPKTPEGKAKSRLNAWSHGLAGAGDIAGPDDPPALVAERTAAFAREWRAVGPTAQILAHRAAVLSVRMERIAARDETLARLGSRQALADFDARRAEEINARLADLDAGGVAGQEARRALRDDPDGGLCLIDHAAEIADAIRAGGPDRPAARTRAAHWLDLPTHPAGAPADPALLDRLAAEVAELRRVAADLEPALGALERDRAAAGAMGAFDLSPEATHARRYEAAAERGFFRILAIIREINRTRDAAEPTPLPAPEPAPTVDPAPTVGPAPADPASLTASPTPPTSALGSFRADFAPLRLGTAEAAYALPQAPPIDPVQHRRSRPDPHKLATRRR